MSRFMAGVMVVVCAAHVAAAQDAARTDGWVVLGIEEYRALRARAFPATPEPAPPPLDATLTRVDYDLRVSGETVTGQARLAIDVLKQGWASVQVPAGMLVRDARIDGRPTPLSVTDGGPPACSLSRTGRSTLTLDVVVPLVASAGTESMTLPASGSALSAVTLIVPRTGVDLAVTGGFVAEQSETGSDSRWVVYGNAGRPLAFTWKRKADDRRADAAAAHARARDRARRARRRLDAGDVERAARCHAGPGARGADRAARRARRQPGGRRRRSPTGTSTAAR